MTPATNHRPAWPSGPIRGQDLWHMCDNDFRNVKWQFWSLGGLTGRAPAGRWSPGWWWWRLSPGPWWWRLITLTLSPSLSAHNDWHGLTEADTWPRVLKAHSGHGSDINIDNVNMLLGSTFFKSLWFLQITLIWRQGLSVWVCWLLVP